MSRLVDDVRALLAEASALYRGRPSAERLAEATRRLDAPLRVAIAGKVKSGKSTLLNALVGEELAPTDAGECTKVVTWYHDGVSATVTMHPRDGAPRQVPFRRDGGALDVDLGATAADDVARLDVSWPSRRLRSITLIDTPGIDSVNTEISRRTLDVLASDDHRARDADAVVYLMRHVHRSDVDFLEAFHDDDLAQPSPVNAVAVLSRADEVGACRPDALDTAARIAARYRTDPALRRLCQTVVPVAGLVAQASATLTETEFRSLATLARLGRERVDALLLSVDRFVREDDTLPITSIEREDLLDRLGLYGVRIAFDALIDGSVSTSAQLVELFRRRSGLDELRAVLEREFTERTAVLVARSALDVIDDVLRDDPVAGTDALLARWERVVASAHELVEIRALDRVRSGAVELRRDLRDELERLLGPGDASRRLGLHDDVDDGQLASAAHRAVERWQTVAEHPLTTLEARDVARVAIRTCEAIATGGTQR